MSVNYAAMPNSWFYTNFLIEKYYNIFIKPEKHDLTLLTLLTSTLEVPWTSVTMNLSEEEEGT